MMAGLRDSSWQFEPSRKSSAITSEDGFNMNALEAELLVLSQTLGLGYGNEPFEVKSFTFDSYFHQR